MFSVRLLLIMSVVVAASLCSVAVAQEPAELMLQNRCLWIGNGMWYGYQRDDGVAGWGDNVVDMEGAFGGVGDVPHLADINGDGLDDKVIVRVSGGGYAYYADYTNADSTWSGGADATGAGGAIGDKFMFGDVNGDGVDDVVMVRSMIWRVRLSVNGAAGFAAGTWYYATGFGDSSQDTPMVGDMNGDGLDDRVLVRRPATGTLKVLVNYAVAGTGFANNTVAVTKTFADANDIDIAISDINGDGTDDIVRMTKTNADKTFLLEGFYTLEDGTLGGETADISYVGADYTVHKWLFGRIWPYEEVCVSPVGDFTGDCLVNIGDLKIFVDHWLECTMPDEPACITID